jgi:RimJ/RimL family protein N-acetyltransferase
MAFNPSEGSESNKTLRNCTDVPRTILTRPIVRVLSPADAEAVSQLLSASSPEYMRFFHPFDFGVTSVRCQLEKAKIDTFFGLVLDSNNESTLAGFYMLRGMDEGYPNPMYGVCVPDQYHGKGLARLTLVHAEVHCALNGWEQILLKVHPENVRAKKLYESVGYRFLREESASGEVVLCKQISQIEPSQAVEW